MSGNGLKDRPVSPRILFVTLKNFVGSERLVAELSRNGLECAVLGWPWGHCARSRFVSRRFFLPPQFGIGVAILFLKQRLRSVLRLWHPDLIIPVDDIAARALRLLAASDDVPAALRELLVRSLGAPDGYAASCDRATLMEIVQRCGVRAPATRRADSLVMAQDAARDFGYPVVLKRDGTSGGAGVDIARTPDELERAFRAYKRRITGVSPRALARAARRFMARLAGLGPVYADSLSVQKHVAGRLAMRTVLARNGKALGGASFEAVKVNPEPTGPSTVIRPIGNSEMDATAGRIVEALKCSGFISFDFILDEKGHAHLIEMNARPIPSVHLSRFAGVDLCALLACALRGEAIPPTSERESDIEIALFPRELERDPHSPYVWNAGSAVFHDVPWNDEPVMKFYLAALAAKHPNLRSDLEALRIHQRGAVRADEPVRVRSEAC